MGEVLTKLDPSIKPKWVEALRSGEYKQVAGMLKGEANCRCCLGVLADVSGAEWRQCTSYSYGAPFIADTLAVSKPGDEYLRDGFAGLSRHTQEQLAKFNDAGKPFTFIADFIEREL